MRGTTHLAAGVAVAALASDLTLGTAAGIMVGSLLPDIDSPKSMVGRHVPILPTLLPHRTITHTVWVIMALWLVSRPLALGCLTHVILDMCNPAGVPLLWPTNVRFRVPFISGFIESGGFIDTLIGGCIWVVNFALYWPLIFPG